MDVCSYASDLNDAEWALLAPLVPRSHPAGRPQTYSLRRIVDGKRCSGRTLHSHV
jgi:transposase